jgi:nitrogen fixation protein NifU and related proteins
MNLYEKHILDHYHAPRHAGALERADFCSQVLHPSCGDEIQIMGTVVQGMIEKVGFVGQGCILSQAAASILLENIVAKPMSYSQSLQKDDVARLIKIPLGPNRFKCVELALQALHQGLAAYQKMDCARGVSKDVRRDRTY